MRNWILIGIILIILFGLGLRVYRLGFPPEMMFDEVYYVKSAQEYIHGDKDTNLYHPPLAKQIIALGIMAASSLNKFVSWRSASLLFGVIMIPLLFMIGRRIYRHDAVALTGALFLAADFLHIVQSRIATLDIFVSSFSLIGFLFGAYYFFPKNRKDEIDPVSAGPVENPDACDTGQNSGEAPAGAASSRPVFLWLSAIFFGIAAACKWSGAFGAFGVLAAIYLIPVDKKRGFLSRTLKEAVPFLVIIFLVYLLSYVSWLLKGTSIVDIFKYHERMLHFRYKEKFEHHYLSYFWQWPTLIRPIWYYYQEEGKKIFGVIATGSPLFWWSFLLMLPFLAVSAWKRKIRADFLVAMGYFSQWLPWAVGYKGCFFYYMIQSVPWMSLWVAVWLYRYLPGPGGRFLRYTFIACAIIMLALWYPLLTGLPISKAYFNHLVWLRVWI
ncbi:MAG: phospholipid carrier-dependent glycosyltransferase [Chloroflexi bacterium]|nr:phospholipid carrier-dependent glycosyltransferase [Chloroflexota bacterium]